MVVTKDKKQFVKWVDLITPPKYRDYYNKLSTKQKGLYELLLLAIIEGKSSIPLPEGFLMSKEAVGTVFHLLIYDHPAICTIGQYAIYDAISKDGKKITIPYLSSSADDERRIRASILREVREILADESLYQKSDVEKELFVHDYVLEHINYDHTHGNGGRCLEPYTVYGPLIQKRGVCEGFAKLCKLLLNLLDVPAIVVSGKQRGFREGHAWNVVGIGNDYYHLDVTNDLAKTMEMPGKLLRRDYFNVSDAVIEKTHTMSNRSLVPICESFRYSYPYLTGGYIRSKEQLEVILLDKIRQRKQLIYLRIDQRILCGKTSEDYVLQAYRRIRTDGHHKRIHLVHTDLAGLVVLRVEYLS